MGGNPITRIDPTGEIWFIPLLLGGGGTAAGGTAAGGAAAGGLGFWGTGALVGGALAVSSIPGDTPLVSSNAFQAECEAACDLEWDRNRAMCKADAAMRGYDSNRFRQCMNEVQRIHIDCIQDCAEDCKK